MIHPHTTCNIPPATSHQQQSTTHCWMLQQRAPCDCIRLVPYIPFAFKVLPPCPVHPTPHCGCQLEKRHSMAPGRRVLNGWDDGEVKKFYMPEPCLNPHRPRLLCDSMSYEDETAASGTYCQSKSIAGQASLGLQTLALRLRPPC